MKRSIATVALVLAACATITRSQTTRPADVAEPENRTFELTPVSPPMPALKYQFLFGLVDRRPGNAAPLYADAAFLLPPDAADKADKALDAYDAKDFKTFDALADSLDLAPVLEELDQAGRREQCDWNPPLREMGARTLLPHLQSLAYGLGRNIRVRALRQIEQGKTDDAIVTLRLGYEMADKVNEPILVSALVSAGLTRWMNSAVADLMTRPECPNLYWALSTLPDSLPTLRRAWEGEHGWIFLCFPALARLRAGEDLTPDQWRKVLVDEMAPLYGIFENYRTVGHRPHPDPIKDAPPEVLRRARQEYAQSHRLSPDQADQVDAAVALGTLYFRQWNLASDEFSKIRNFPYPALLARTAESDAALAKLRKEHPTNPFLLQLTDFHKSTRDFARTDRQLAALIAVEALRSYAATHDGALPKQLSEVIETPVPLNPATGRPFDYRLDNDTATLSDAQTEAPMTYTIKIRK